MALKRKLPEFVISVNGTRISEAVVMDKYSDVNYNGSLLRSVMVASYSKGPTSAVNG